MFATCLLVLLSIGCFTSAIDYETQWKTWKSKYNKVYDNNKEEERRLNIFKTNIDQINGHNTEAESKSSETTWYMKLNQFGDMTPKEFKNYARCAKFDDKIEYSDQFLNQLQENKISINDLQNPGLNSVTDIPDAVDWTQKDNIVTPVKNQGNCGACWAFGATGCIESRYAIAHGELNSLSEQELIDCAGDDSNCNGGYSDMGFLYAMWNYGLSLEADYPYIGTDGHECAKTAHKHYDAVDGLIAIERYNKTALMAAVSQGPVTIGIEASEEFEYYGSGVFDGLCGTDVDHMVLIVGYNRTGDNPYWKVKNSWGDDWGEDGYIRICMDCDKNGQSGECCILCYPSVAYFDN